jgi:hypothetical protein
MKPLVKRSFRLLCMALLVFLAFMETYCLLWIALDHLPPHRPWWEYCGIALSWVMLTAFVIGFSLLCTSKSTTMGVRLVIANIAVFYGIMLFDIFTDVPINKVSFELLADYSAIAFVELLAAISLRKLALTKNVND